MEKSKMKRKDGILFVILLAVIVLVLRFPTFYQAIIDIDESVFAEFANRFLDGAIPYVSVFDNKPPFVYWYFSSIFSVFGHNSFFAVHFTTALIVFATALMIWRIVLRIGSPSAAVIAPLAYLFMTHAYEPKYVSTSTEILMNLPLVLSVYFYIESRIEQKPYYYKIILSGFFLGMAVMVNYKAGFLAIGYMFNALRRISISQIKSRVSASTEEISVLGICGFASLIPIACTALYFYNHGAIKAFIEWGFLYNFSYIGESTKVPISRTFRRVFYFIVASFPVWLVLLYSFRFRWKKILFGSKHIPNTIVLIVVWFITSWAASMLGGRTYGHYFIQVALPASILTGIAASILIKMNKHSFMKFFWRAQIVLIVFFTILRINIGFTHKVIGYENWKADGVFKDVGRYVKNISKADDTIFVWGWGTPVYIYADRRSFSQILIANYISGKPFGSSDLAGSGFPKEFLDQMRDNFLKQMEKNPPSFFIDTSPSGLYGYHSYPIGVFPELLSVIEQKYAFEGRIENVDIYRLK